MESTKAQIRQFIVDNFYVPSAAALADDESLRDTGVIDSTGVLELLHYIEERFEVAVQDAEVVAANFDSIDKIASFIGRKKAAAVSAA
jgi:acyl carrier protein